MNLIKKLKLNRINIETDLRGSPEWKYFSPTRYATHLAVRAAISQHARGKVIDIGCGMMHYKEFITKLPTVTRYDALDIEARAMSVDIIGDVQNMDAIKSNTYDTVLCLQVIEHIPNPFRAINEIYRILKPNGVLILSAPHLSRLHEEPNDFYRYTKYGLRYMLEKSEFKDISIIPVGGLFSFIGQQISMALVIPFWHIPIIKHIVFFINKWLIVKTCFLIDLTFDKNKLFAVGYVCIAKK
ncbi:MAG TPA: class I SAM-dependent methyltransferase [Candidatus Paceibacterota bacterium]